MTEISDARASEDVYKTISDTWRYEVDSYWQRNNYFAAFETAALAGCWYVVEHAHPWLGLSFFRSWACLGGYLVHYQHRSSQLC